MSKLPAYRLSEIEKTIDNSFMGRTGVTLKVDRLELLALIEEVKAARREVHS